MFYPWPDLLMHGFIPARTIPAQPELRFALQCNDLRHCDDLSRRVVPRLGIRIALIVAVIREPEVVLQVQFINA